MKYLKTLFGGALALSACSLMASDSYDTYTSILTTGQVKVGTMLYKNVAVLLDAVLALAAVCSALAAVLYQFWQPVQSAQ